MATVPSDELAAEIKAAVAAELGKAFQPDRVLFVSALPKTRSAKIVRRLIQRRHLGETEPFEPGFDPLEFDRYTRLQELTRLMAESLNDVVERISRVRVRETLPDKVLELADEIESNDKGDVWTVRLKDGVEKAVDDLDKGLEAPAK